MPALVQAILWQREPTPSLRLLDQRLLPARTEYVEVADTRAAWLAIKDMVVRGAPALAVAAALSLAREACGGDGGGSRAFSSASEAADYFVERASYLETSRPTAVNLAEATNRMAAAAKAAAALPEATADSVREAVVAAAESYLAADVAANVALGEAGADAVLASSPSSDSSSSVAVLTHCNAGALATAGHGTALGVVRSLAARGKLAHAFCTETRPYNQGSRLTAFELASEGFPATLLCDSAAAALLVHGGSCSGVSQDEEEGGGDGAPAGAPGGKAPPPPFVGKPHAVVVGADRVAANGDTANKVGTLALAVAAKRGGVPFFVAAPTTTLDALLPSGKGIPIEQRPAREVTHSRGGEGERVAAEGVRVWNPSFDVTPADLITGGIITEKGMVPRRKRRQGEEEETPFFDVAAFVAEHATGPAAEAAKKKIAEEPGDDDDDPLSSSSFEQLDCASVAEYVASRPALASLVGDPSRVSEWDVKEVGDGNINFVFIVRGEKPLERAIVVKQALPFIRIAPDWPLSVDRARIEAAALKEHGRLLALQKGEEEAKENGREASSSSSPPPPSDSNHLLIPRVHLYDPERALIAMDFVAPPAAVVRGHLVAGKIVPGLAEDVAEYAAVTLFGTSLLAVSDTAAWRSAAASFANPALCALTEQVVFTDPYYAAKVNRHTSPQLDAAADFLRRDAEGAAWAQRLKLRFSGTREALLHGDLHTGSVMGVGVEVDDEGIGSGSGGASAGGGAANRPRAVVIDPEFAFYGPIGFDLAEFTANLLMAFLATDGKKGEEKSSTRQRAWLAESITTFWDHFELHFRALWAKAASEGKGGAACPAALFSFAEGTVEAGISRLEKAQDVFLAAVRDDAVRFAGCCILRRIVGIAHVEDFEAIADADARGECEARALRLGREMMVGGSAAFGSFGALVEAAETERGRAREEGWVGGGR